MVFVDVCFMFPIVAADECCVVGDHHVWPQKQMCGGGVNVGVGSYNEIMYSSFAELFVDGECGVRVELLCDCK